MDQRPTLRLKTVTAPEARPPSRPSPSRPSPSREATEKADVAQKRARIIACRDELSERFPAAFRKRSDPAPWRPLKIGIHHDLFERAPDMSKTLLRRALGRYVTHPAYRIGLSEGGPRIDLDGNEAGIVTADQARSILAKGSEP